MQVVIRKAQAEEIDWINHCYDTADCMRSTFANEIIVIAEVDGKRAGLARLVHMDKNYLELSGVYVLEEYRRQSVATKLVEYLLKQTQLGQKVYCIPFSSLLSFYEKFGFVLCENLESIPIKLLKKICWCLEKYSEKMLFLELKELTKRVPTVPSIAFEDFNKIDMRVGTILAVEPFPEARKPAWKLTIDFGAEIGIKKSSAQITDHYTQEKLLGKQVVAVVNFPAKKIANFTSEVLVLGLSDAHNHIVLLAPEQSVPNGKKIH